MTATFDQEIVQLVDQIRGQVPANQQENISIDNISLMLNLLEVFDHSKDSSLKSLIKQLFDCAGNSWSRLLALREAKTPVEIPAKQ
jgi:hypothetical protein